MSDVVGKPSARGKAKAVAAVKVAVTALIVAVVLTVSIKAFSSAGASEQIGPGAYQEVRQASDICPPIRPVIQRAISDNVITKVEYDAIGDAFAVAARSYSTYIAMAEAKKGLGMIPPPSVPRCLSEADDFPPARPFPSWTNP